MILAGKKHWISSRRDKVVAKGKGEMQTYWVMPQTQAGSATTHNTQSTATDASDNATSHSHSHSNSNGDSHSHNMNNDGSVSSLPIKGVLVPNSGFEYDGARNDSGAP